MQLRYLLLCSAVVLMGCCHPAAAAAQEPPCYVTGEGVSDVTCSASASLQEIGDFLKQLSSSNGVAEYNKFGLYDNLVVQHLPAGLLADLRFSVVEVMSCSNLTKVDDFLGASSASLKNLSMNGNSLTEIPQLNAPALQNLRIFQSDITVVVRRSALQGMPNIEVLCNEHRLLLFTVISIFLAESRDIACVSESRKLMAKIITHINMFDLHLFSSLNRNQTSIISLR